MFLSIKLKKEFVDILIWRFQKSDRESLKAEK